MQGSFRVPVGLLFGKDATTGYCYATPIIPTLAALATKAGRVRTRHEKELMAIAGVNSVSVSNDLGDVNPVIVVWVIDSKKLNSVERAAPDSLEGFPVEVGAAGHGFAL